jgi:hypothetical protein
MDQMSRSLAHWKRYLTLYKGVTQKMYLLCFVIVSRQYKKMSVQRLIAHPVDCDLEGSQIGETYPFLAFSDSLKAVNVLGTWLELS